MSKLKRRRARLRIDRMSSAVVARRAGPPIMGAAGAGFDEALDETNDPGSHVWAASSAWSK